MDERNNSQKQDVLVDKVFGGCRLIKKIGEGGMGVVYLAHHLALNKNVAVKILPPSFATEEERVKRFVREARSAAQLEHSNIIQIYNIAKHEDFYFIVMQYADGESLAHAIKREGKINVLEALDIVKDVASALSVAHRKSIVHRDIKPENIMINSNGEVKLMDFGLARVLDVASNLSRTGDILGTPYYLSPEQAQGHKVDGRADIYSLGVTFYYMLSGKKPFEGDTTLSIILKHINEKPPIIRQTAPEIPECISNVINKMLEKDPGKRYQSADELIDDINLCHNGIVAEDSDAKTITAQTAPAKAKPRKIISWKMIGSAAILAVALVMLISMASKKKPAAQTPNDVNPITVNNPPNQEKQEKIKNNLTRRCNECYAYLVNKDYEQVRNYVYVAKHKFIQEEKIRPAVDAYLKSIHDFQESFGNRIKGIKIKDIRIKRPSTEIPLVYAEVDINISYYNIKSADDHKITPQTHIWVLKEDLWYWQIKPPKAEDNK